VQRGAIISVMQDCDAAQARELIRALCDHLREMTQHLARVEGRYLPGPDGHPARREAVALRRNIAEAQKHIDRLQRRLPPRLDRAMPALPGVARSSGLFTLRQSCSPPVA
jgi:hypothetical protein